MLCVVTSPNPSVVKNRVGFGCTNKPEERCLVIEATLRNSKLASLTNFIDASIDVDFQDRLCRIHEPSYVHFVRESHSSLMRSGDPNWISQDGALIPNHVATSTPNSLVPLYKHSGFYVGDCMTPIYHDSYTSAVISAQQSVYAAHKACVRGRESGRLLNRAAYALVDSPGHHAKYGKANGYCFFNNAFIAAHEMRTLLGGGATKIAILDLDFHAGNGTAEMVSNDKAPFGDVFAVSIHADPAHDYPSFDGYASENVENQILNICMHAGTDWAKYETALIEALDAIDYFKPEGLIVAFGGDTYKDDPDASPIARFSLDIEDYSKMSSMIVEKMGNDIPIVITQEGGYNMEHIGSIVTSFMSGFFTDGQ